MKPSSIARRGYTKDSIPPARRFLGFAARCGWAARACLRKAESWNNPPGHGKLDAVGCDRAGRVPGKNLPRLACQAEAVPGSMHQP